MSILQPHHAHIHCIAWTSESLKGIPPIDKTPRDLQPAAVPDTHHGGLGDGTFTGAALTASYFNFSTAHFSASHTVAGITPWSGAQEHLRPEPIHVR